MKASHLRRFSTMSRRMVESMAIVATRNTKSTPFRPPHPLTFSTTTTSQDNPPPPPLPPQKLHQHLSNSTTFQSCKYSDQALLISNAISSTHNIFTDKTQFFLTQFSLNESLVLELLNLLKTPQKLVTFFIWAKSQSGYSPIHSTYNCLLENLGFDYSTKFPDQFVREIANSDKEVEGKLFNLFVQKICQKGLWSLALEEFRRLRDLRYRFSRTTFNELVLALIKGDQLDTALATRRQMLVSRFNVSRFTIGCFVRCLGKAGRCEEAFEMIDGEKYSCDRRVYSELIYGLCEGCFFDEAVDVLHRMRLHSCIPDDVMYKTLLSSCSTKEKLDSCKRIVSLMMSDGSYPSPSMFKFLFHVYCNSRDYAYGYELLKKMKESGIKPSFVLYNKLIGYICRNEVSKNSELLEVAEKAYGEMLDNGFVLPKLNVGYYVRCLCEAEKFDKAFSVVSEMMSIGFVPDTRTYSNVIDSFCKASKLENAFFLFREMKENRITPNVYTYTILIDSLCKVGLIRAARNLFGEMIRSGCTPNVVTFTAFIHGYLKASRVADANDLFEKMISDGCVPNIVTYTALIDGYCRAGDVKKACQIYSRMKGDESIPDVSMYFRGDGSTTLNPNVFTYGALVYGLCKDSKVAEARELLNAMSLEGCDPNLIVYTALVDGFCKIGDLDEVKELFSEMSRCGYNPNAYTYSSLIDRLVKDERLDLAWKVLSEMLNNSCPPDVVIYTNIICGLCRVGKTDEAYRVLLMMEGKGFRCDAVSYTVMIDGFAKVGNVRRSLKLFEQMVEKGSAPDCITYIVLIKHCCTAGLLDEAHKLLEEGKKTYWPRNVDGYLKGVKGLGKEVMLSLGILDEVLEDGYLPIGPAYRILIDSYLKAGELEMALKLHTEIVESLGVSALNENVQSSLVESLSLACKVEKAFELYTDLARRDHVPEIHVFFYLILGLIKINKWSEALLLSHSICNMDIYWQPREETSDQTSILNNSGN